MDILMFKSILTILVLFIAILQALSMLQVMGRIRLVNVSSPGLRLFHKGGGDVTLLLMLATAFLCLTRLTATFQGPRVFLHALFALCGLATILLKFAIARFFRAYLRYSQQIGATLFLFIAGIFLTSALWHLFTT
ncbi:MAG: DUF6529 family protein [Candidatus Binatia bacterium]